MPAAKYDIIVDQHQDFLRGFSIKVDDVILDLTNYTFEAQLRERSQSDTAYNFTIDVVDPLAGLINMIMADTITATIPAGNYVYDLVQIDPQGVKTRLLEGEARVVAGVTR